MTPAPRRKPAAGWPWPCQAGQSPPGCEPIDPPEDPRPEPKRGPTLPAGFERMLSIDDLAALLNCSRRLVERMRSCRQGSQARSQDRQDAPMECPRRSADGSRGRQAMMATDPAAAILARLEQGGFDPATDRPRFVGIPLPGPQRPPPEPLGQARG